MATNDGNHVYVLRIDGPLLSKQRQWLLDQAERTSNEGRDHLEGILALLDEIADQAYEQHGIDCLLMSEDRMS